MSHAAKNLHKFYSSGLGRTSTAVLNRQIGELWESGRNLRVLGCGYTIPFQNAVTRHAEKSLMAVPEVIGPLVWSHQNTPGDPGGNDVVLVESGALPFGQNTFDRLLAVHFLELSPHLAGDLYEMHRVLQPEGQLVLVVPNRLGLWARSNAVPFSTGLPFTSHQIRRALEQAGFQVERCETALHFAPGRSRFNLWTSGKIEKFVKWIGRPGGGGVLIVSARKRLVAPKRPKGLGMRLRHLWELAPKPVHGPARPVPVPSTDTYKTDYSQPASGAKKDK